MENADKMDGKIAVVGMDCRLPGANNVAEYWNNLVLEKESIIEFSDDELLAAGVPPSVFNNPNYVKKRGVVKDADQFDAEFFSYTPREAELLDPQHRLFLECSWHALEDAGIDPHTTDKKVSVFGGTGSPYYLVDTINNKNVLKFANGTAIITSSDKDYVATRVSYKLNLKGASVNVQSACSTSMVALSLGIDSLLNYQSDIILAGGSTIGIPVNKGYMYQPGSLESPEGICRTFDKDAKGTVFSRGCAVVALKRLEDAIADKDDIYAVILGGAINNDGNRKAGYTAPSVQGQVEVITEALEYAEVDPRTISMVEAHGTATLIGDPIEVTSLCESFSQYTSDKQFCALGSVKTNIGHTDVASGVASLIKTCMSLKHGIIPASLNYREPNPAIDFVKSPFYVNTKTKKWETQNNTPKRAIVNSFGVGGTNVCMVLEEPPVLENDTNQKDYDLLLVSAHNKTSYENYLKDISEFLLSNPTTNLNALAHTSRISRSQMKFKGTFAFKNYDDLLSKLNSSVPNSSKYQQKKDLAFMFPGQGNQFINMGLDLYNNSSIFKNYLDQCAKIIESIIDVDIREIIYPKENYLEKASELIDHTYITQPAIFAISYAVAKTLIDLNVEPDVLIGHSVGEYVAAAISGIMSLEDAVKSVVIRGKLVFNLPKGSMLAVLLTETEINKILPKELSVAVVNSPELVVVSGESDYINSFATKLNEDKIFNKLLPTSHAFHSKMMIPCLEEYREFFKNIQLATPKIPIISTVTGELLTNQQSLDHEYWVQHVVNPVRFGDAAEKLLNRDAVVFLECGPGQSLESAIKRRITKESNHTCFSTMSEPIDSVIALDSALGKLWIENIKVDFNKRYNSENLVKIHYPLLPFNRKSYLVEFEEKNSLNEAGNFKKENINDWYYMPSWQKTSKLALAKKNSVIPTFSNEKWIIFIESDLSKKIADILIGEENANICIVEKGEHFTRSGNEFSIRISEKEDYFSLFKSLSEEKCKLNIIHTWNFSEHDTDEINLENFGSYLDRGFYSLMFIEQALVANNLLEEIKLCSIINDGYDITGTGKILPEKALSVGPIRVIFKEHKEISSLLLNLECYNENLYPDLVRNIIQEVRCDTDDTIISYTGLTRWKESFINIQPEPVIDNQIPMLLKNDGVYLITGGSGGIGRVLSSLISTKLERATIIWTGASELPARNKWDILLQDKNFNLNLKEKIKAIIELEKEGLNVYYYCADVSDYNAMKIVFDDVEDKYGKIDGIIHSAGIAGGGVVALKEKSICEKVLDPKIKGTLIIKKLIQDKEIDFVCLFSSITAILGEAGRVDYISANAFMDAACNNQGFIHKSAAVSSINWGQWGVIGMAADYQSKKNDRKSLEANSQQIKYSTECNPIELEVINNDNNIEISHIKIDIDKSWILNEHLLTGIPTMVGTSYLEALMQWKIKQNIDGEIVIGNAEFLSPLMIMKNMPKQLCLFCERIGDKKFKFIFKSTNSLDGNLSEKEWQDHFEGTLYVENLVEKHTDIESIIEKLNYRDNTPHFLSVRDSNNKALLQYSKRWDCKAFTQIGTNEWLTKLSLPMEFNNDLEKYFTHPAMLDVATSAHFMYLDLGNFLPFSYETVKVYAPFENTLYCHTKLNTAKDQNDKYIYFDFQLYNSKGILVFEILNYAFVNLDDDSTGKKASAAALKTNIPTVEEGDILPEEGSKVLECILNNPELRQTIVFTKDLNKDFKETKISFLRKEHLQKIKKQEAVEDIDDRPDIDTVYIEPENEIEKTIQQIWTSILGINKIGVNDTFYELGGNSLLSIQVASGITEEFSIDISVNAFMNAPTIKLLSELVIENILDGHSLEEIESLINE